MAEDRGINDYFEKRKIVKKLMEQMLKDKAQWTRQVKKDFEKAWSDCCKAYDKHESFCKKRKESRVNYFLSGAGFLLLVSSIFLTLIISLRKLRKILTFYVYNT